MGKKDKVLHTYMSKPERIRSVLEYYTKEKLPDNWVALCKDEPELLVGQNSKGQQSSRQRDVFKKIESEDGTYYVGIENQEKINLIFPWRLMQMDCLTYEKQIRKIQEVNEKAYEKSKRTANKAEKLMYGSGDDFLYQYFKGDRIALVINLVLYWGKKTWKIPKGIADMLRNTVMPPGMQQMFQEYRIHLIHMREISDEDLECMDSDLKYVLGLMKRADSPEEYERYIHENKEYFSHIPKSAVDVLDTYMNLKVMMKVLEYRNADNGEEEEADMCIALDTIERNAIERGLAKGMAQGIEQGIEKGIEKGIEVFILDHQEDGTSKERVLEKLIRRFGLSSEKAEGYLLKYNYVHKAPTIGLR